MTLRQCFYILVSEGLIPNTTGSYKRLSELSAVGRRESTFPSFLDGTRDIIGWQTYDSPEEALDAAAQNYMRDRTEGQPYQLWIAGEKRTLRAQLVDWFAPLGSHIVLCAGYSSQTLCDDVQAVMEEDGRPSVLIYAGDLDPSGEDIARDFIERVDSFDVIERVAVLPEQIASLSLVPQPGKDTDSRAGDFIDRHGSLFQVEVEAIHPNTLRKLYQDAIDKYLDVSEYDRQVQRENDERESMREWIL